MSIPGRTLNSLWGSSQTTPRLLWSMIFLASSGDYHKELFQENASTLEYGGSLTSELFQHSREREGACFTAELGAVEVYTAQAFSSLSLGSDCLQKADIPCCPCGCLSEMGPYMPGLRWASTAYDWLDKPLGFGGQYWEPCLPHSPVLYVSETKVIILVSLLHSWCQNSVIIWGYPLSIRNSFKKSSSVFIVKQDRTKLSSHCTTSFHV